MSNQPKQYQITREGGRVIRLWSNDPDSAVALAKDWFNIIGSSEKLEFKEVISE